MSNALKVARLDFLTVNAFIPRKAVILFLVLIFPFSALGSGGFTTMAVCVTIFLSVAIVSYPFTVGEKSNVDMLLGVLGTDRVAVVSGRYMFTILTNIIVILTAIIISLFDLAFYTIIRKSYDLSIIPMLILTLATFVTFFEFITLPIYFRKPYSKAKATVWIVYCIFGGFSGFLIGTVGDGSFSEIFRALGNLYPSDSALILTHLIFLVVAMILSYLISVHNYKKREF